MHSLAHVQVKKCIYAPGCSLLFLLWPVTVSFYASLCWGSSWVFQSLETGLQYKLFGVTTFLHIGYSLGVRNAGLLFVTTCQLPALHPLCWYNAMYHSHPPFKNLIFPIVHMQWFKNKTKTPPKQNTKSSHHHICILACISSCLDCVLFDWVIFNHFPSESYKAFSNVREEASSKGLCRHCCEGCLCGI